MKERMDENHPWVTEDDIEFIQCNNQFQLRNSAISYSLLQCKTQKQHNQAVFRT